MLKQIHRGRPQQQQTPVGAALGPAPVDHSAQRLEDFRSPLHLVQNHKFALVIGHIAGGVGNAHPVLGLLEIQIDGVPPFADLESHGSFAHLSRSQQDYGWIVLQ